MIQRLSARGKTDKETQLHQGHGSGRKKEEKKRERRRRQKENERKRREECPKRNSV